MNLKDIEIKTPWVTFANNEGNYFKVDKDVFQWLIAKIKDLEKRLEGYMVKESCGLIPPDDWKEKNDKLEAALKIANEKNTDFYLKGYRTAIEDLRSIQSFPLSRWSHSRDLKFAPVELSDKLVPIYEKWRTTDRQKIKETLGEK